MAFVLEDGTGLTNSTAYITPAEMTSYHLDRNVEISAQYDDTQKQRSIVVASDYVDLVWGPDLRGYVLVLGQAMMFPRQCLYSKSQCWLLLTGVPKKLKYAVAEYALREMITPGSLMPDPVVSDTGMQVLSTSEKVGPIEEKVLYTGAAVQSRLSFPKADRWMYEFVNGTGGGSYRA